MCDHEGQPCPDGCRCECMNCMFPAEVDEDIEFDEVAPDVWAVAPGSRDEMQRRLDDAMRRAFGKSIKEMFPES